MIKCVHIPGGWTLDTDSRPYVLADLYTSEETVASAALEQGIYGPLIVRAKTVASKNKRSTMSVLIVDYAGANVTCVNAAGKVTSSFLRSTGDALRKTGATATITMAGRKQHFDVLDVLALVANPEIRALDDDTAAITSHSANDGEYWSTNVPWAIRRAPQEWQTTPFAGSSTRRILRIDEHRTGEYFTDPSATFDLQRVGKDYAEVCGGLLLDSTFDRSYPPRVARFRYEGGPYLTYDHGRFQGSGPRVINSSSTSGTRFDPGIPIHPGLQNDERQYGAFVAIHTEPDPFALRTPFDPTSDASRLVAECSSKQWRAEVPGLDIDVTKPLGPTIHTLKA